MDIKERSHLQTWTEGRDGEIDLFSVMVGGWGYFGVEISGIIYYITTNENQDKVLIFIKLGNDEWKGLVDIIDDISEPRFKVLSNHCPKFCRAIIDGFSNDTRYDRGAFATIGDSCVLAITMPYDFKSVIESDDPFEAFIGNHIENVVIKLISLQSNIIDELTAFDGYSTEEEIRISAKEIFNGVRIAWKFNRIMDVLLG